jgi:transcriptional regulator with XRE-family HTH domain
MTKKEIDTFFEDVQLIGFKFPVAQIAKLTGFNKSNVSEFLNYKKEPSENFINAFYDALKREKITIPGKSDSIKTSKQVTEAEVIDLLKDHIKRLESNHMTLDSHFQWLQKMFEEMKERTFANLATADSDRLVIMSQLKNLTMLAAEIFAAGDKRKYEEKMKEYRKQLGADGAAKT